MRIRFLSIGLALPILASACHLGNDADNGGPVTIAIQQSLTGETTAAGTFRMSGSLADEGNTTEEITFGGPLNQPTVPVTFRRTLTGKNGTLVLKGPAALSFTTAAAAAITGSWTVESATGRYAGLGGSGSLTGSANFGATPPSASIAFTGVVAR